MTEVQPPQVTAEMMEKGRSAGERQAGAFAAAIFAALLTNVSLEARTFYLTLSLNLLSVAVPGSIALWYSFRPLIGRWQPMKGGMAWLLTLIGYGAGLAGLNLMILHFSRVAAAMFLAGSVAAIALTFVIEFRAFRASQTSQT